jgi:cystathionine beta-lyase
MRAAQRTITARRDQLTRRLAADAPTIGYHAPEATYLAWLDFTEVAAGAVGVSLGDDPAEYLLKHAGVALSNGPKFGTEGVGVARLNFATSEQILDDAIDRIVRTIDQDH